MIGAGDITSYTFTLTHTDSQLTGGCKVVLEHETRENVERRGCSDAPGVLVFTGSARCDMGTRWTDTPINLRTGWTGTP